MPAGRDRASMRSSMTFSRPISHSAPSSRYFIGREEAERFVGEVRGHDPEVVGEKLKIAERGSETRGPN